ncbi:MAG: DUF4251 domain-containing protein [Prolixibacteraceae bacterium]|nr:DUF4251 domain-containing protein [Prolixibacteraceae bacterium]
MKTIAVISLLLVSIPFYAQNTKKELKEARKAEEFKQMKEIIEARDFMFVADYALPTSGSSISLTTNPNHLTFSGDSVYCDMPFFGRAYQVDFDFDAGIDFSGIPHFFDVTENERRNKILVRFKIRGDFDLFNCSLTITGVESATLTINSNNRASISYWGKIKEKEK